MCLLFRGEIFDLVHFFVECFDDVIPDLSWFGAVGFGIFPELS